MNPKGVLRAMETLAVTIEAPERLTLRSLALAPPGATDLIVEIHWSGISSGTEKLLWNGDMPPFPGMGYPLVPGYESVGRVIDAGRDARSRIGEWVFVPGSNGFTDARGLFGGSARRVVLPTHRAVKVPEILGEKGILLALAATAHHAIANAALPQLIVGHGILGRLIARITMALGGPTPTVWETSAGRSDGSTGYTVTHPDADTRTDYPVILDASGSVDAIDTMISHLGKQGEIILAGFYSEPIRFTFPPAFMREARLRIAAEWQPQDLEAVTKLVTSGKLSLDNLITDIRAANDAEAAYPAAFADPAPLKMVLDWRDCA